MVTSKPPARSSEEFKRISVFSQSMDEHLDGRLTEDEVYSIVAYGARLIHPQHSDLFSEIGYGRASALNRKILRSYIGQIDAFIEAEDGLIFNGQRPPRNAGISGSVAVAGHLSEEDYAELIHPDRGNYDSHLEQFVEEMGLGAASHKKSELLRRTRGRTDHFCSHNGTDRTLFDYNPWLFQFDGEMLAEDIKKTLGIADENLGAYTPDFGGLVKSYADLTPYLLQAESPINGQRQ